MSPATLWMTIAFAVVYLVWGSTYLAIRFAIETLPPFLMAAVRFLIAGGVVYAWARLRGVPRPSLAEWRSATVIGGLLLLGGNGGVVYGEQTLSSGLAALIVAGVPFWVVLLDWASPWGSRPSGVVVAGLVVGFVGLVVLIDPLRTAIGIQVDLRAATVVVAGSFCWSLGTVLAPRLAMPKSLLLGTAMEMLSGGALLFALAVVTGQADDLDIAQASLRSLGAFAYLVVFGSIVAFNAYVYLLQVASPTRVATYAYVNPVVAVLLGWWLAGEEIGPRVVVAAAIIVPAVALVTLGRSTPRHTPAAAAEPEPDPPTVAAEAPTPPA